MGSSTMTAQTYLLYCRVRSADIPDIESTATDGRQMSVLGFSVYGVHHDPQL